MKGHRMKKAFSLIELIVVIAITAVLLAIALPNFLSARERARDSKRKEEMLQLKNALRMYYTDFQVYPTAGGNCDGSISRNYIVGCGADHISCCPCDASGGIGFAVGTALDTCQTVYMKKFPDELGSRIYYYPAATTDDFCLKVALENPADPDIASSQTRCTAACSGANLKVTDYAVCAD